MTLNELKEKLKAELLAAKAIADAAVEEDRDFTAEERQKLRGHIEEAGKLKAKIKELEGDESLRQTVLALGEGLDFGDGKTGGRAPASVGRGQTTGEQFVNAPAFKAWLQQVAPAGQIPESARGLHSPPIEFKSLIGRKAPLTGASDTSAGAFVATDVTGIYEPLGRRPLTLRDLISIRQTSSDLVEFVRQTAQVTQAAPVGEAVATGDGSGAKPEGSMAFEKVQVPVRTIAVWLPATKRALSDVAQLRGIIDQELRDDLEEVLEDEILNGGGTGEHFTGILNTPGVLIQAYTTDLLTTTRKALTAVRTLGRARPTAWVLHPADWETIDLLKDAQGQYYFGGPLHEGTRTLWGVPVVESEAVPEGTALVGDFRRAVLWDRERATIQVSDSHADFFIRNRVAILAELRAAFGVLRPAAFVKVDLTAT